MPIQYTNNAKTTLAVSITATQTTLVVASGDGGLFPHTANNTTFPITIVDAAHIEICNCTSRNGDVFVVERAAEGTQRFAFTVAAIIELRITAGSLDDRFDEHLRIDQNLGDVADKAAARTNIGLQNSATMTVGQVKDAIIYDIKDAIIYDIKDSIIDDLKKATIDELYPVGGPPYIAINDSTSPEAKWPWMTWQPLTDGFLYPKGAAGSGAVGTTGGEREHTLTDVEMPEHGHSGTTSSSGSHAHSYTDIYPVIVMGSNFLGNDGGDIENRSHGRSTNAAGAHSHTLTTDKAGGGQPHNNMPPFITVFMWQRVA